MTGMAAGTSRSKWHDGPHAGARRRTSAILELARRLALAFVTFVCVTIATNSGQVIVNVPVPLDGASASKPTVVRGPSAPEPSSWQAAAERPFVDQAVESDDDDGSWDVSEDSTEPFRSVPVLRSAGQRLRPEPSVAPSSRYARGPGLARAPPV